MPILQPIPLEKQIEAAQRVADGETVEKVAKSMGIAKKTVTKYFLRSGLKRKPKEHAIAAAVSLPKNKDSTILVIPDLHCPWQHPDALAFLMAVRDRFKPTDFVCLGDEIDAMGFSRYPQDPDAPNQSKELEMSIEQLLPFYREFPNMKVCESNHSIRPWKKAFEAGLPKSFLPTVARVLHAPDGWVWKNSWVIDDVLYIHGDAGSSGFTAHIQYMRKFKQSVCIGHIHSYGGVNYEGPIFGANFGCLIDKEAICFKYAKNMPIPVSLGCGIVKNGNQAYFIPLITGEDGRWIGRI